MEFHVDVVDLRHGQYVYLKGKSVTSTLFSISYISISYRDANHDSFLPSSGWRRNIFIVVLIDVVKDTFDGRALPNSHTGQQSSQKEYKSHLHPGR